MSTDRWAVRTRWPGPPASRVNWKCVLLVPSRRNYTTWRLDICRHSAIPCPQFLVAVTYATLGCRSELDFPTTDVHTGGSDLASINLATYGTQAFAYAVPTYPATLCLTIARTSILLYQLLNAVVKASLLLRYVGRKPRYH